MVTYDDLLAWWRKGEQSDPKRLPPPGPEELAVMAEVYGEELEADEEDVWRF